jgi:hypothetical protein
MYGIVNRALQEMISERYGEEKWEAVKSLCNIDIDYFISNEPYPDEISYKLVGAVSEEMKIPASEILYSLGQWWVLRTGKEKYGSLMEAGGDTLKEFLGNLPLFHSRVMLIYPNLTPPEFQVETLTDHSAIVHYFSQRMGLKDFVTGLLHGLGKMYNTPIETELLTSRNDGGTHEIFKVTW